MEKTKQLASMAVGIIAVIVIILALVWLSNTTSTSKWLKTSITTPSSKQLNPEETAKILAQLSRPAVDVNGKTVAPPSPVQTAKILEQLSKPASGPTASRQPTPEEAAKILEQLSKPAK
jgi:phage gp16-like protein